MPDISSRPSAPPNQRSEGPISLVSANQSETAQVPVTLEETNAPDFNFNETPFMRQLETIYFDVPSDVGIPEEKDRTYPSDALGNPDEKFEFYPDPDAGEENDDDPDDDLTATAQTPFKKINPNYPPPKAEYQDNPDPGSGYSPALNLRPGFTYNRGLPSENNTTQDDSPSGPVHDAPPPGYTPPAIAADNRIRFVVGKPKGKSSMEVQTVIFYKNKWSESEARAWLKKHGMKSGKVDETDDSFRFRQKNPGQFEEDSFRTITPGQKKEEASMRVAPEVDAAAAAFAENITLKTMTNIFGSPEGALYSLYDYARGDLRPSAGLVQMAAKWTRAYINDLPDSAFAVIEPAYKSGKADNKNARHLPHHDKGGEIDAAHLKNALARMNQVKPVTDSISASELQSKAKSHLEAHARKEGIGNHEKASSEKEAIMATQTGTPMDPAKMQGPNDPETFPGGKPPEKAQADYSPPSDPKRDSKVPLTEGPNDPKTFPGNAPAPGYTPPSSPQGDSKTPLTPGPNDSETFPAHAARDLNLSTPPGPQAPEYDRHNPYQKQQRLGTPGGPKPPWDRKSQIFSNAVGAAGTSPDPTPGMEFLSDSSKVDAHVTGLEQLAQEVDLYHKRYAKNATDPDLKSASDRFVQMRALMGQVQNCQACMANKGAQSYAKELFSYSYGQVRHGMTRALRQFTEKDRDPDLPTYHALLALKADLLGEETQKYLSAAYKPFVVMAEEEFEEALFGAGPVTFTSGSGYVSVAAAKKDSKNSKDGGDDDMKPEDVQKAVEVVRNLEKAGLITEAQFAAKITEVAAMTPENRNAFVEMAGNLIALKNPATQAGAPVTAQAAVGAQVASLNLVPNPVKQFPEGTGQPQKRPTMLGLFSGRNKSPIHQFGA